MVADKAIDGPVALFVRTGDTDDSDDKAAAIFWSQFLASVIVAADRELDGRLERPMHVVLNDLASGSPVPNLDKVVSQCRSRNIALTLVVQSITQLEDRYGSAATHTIRESCDHTVFMGGNDPDTADVIGRQARMDPELLMALPIHKCVVTERGSRSVVAEKWDLERDPLWDIAVAAKFYEEFDRWDADAYYRNINKRLAMGPGTV